MNRRNFLGTLAAGGAAAMFGSFLKRADVLAKAKDFSDFTAAGFGSLAPKATLNTGETFLALPQGFEYKVFGKVGSPMSDGQLTPAAHDGMEVFKVGSDWRLVRNHEVSNSSLPMENAGIGKTNHYDDTAGGGTTTLVINPKTLEVKRDFVSLSGTLINCAGGKTPWGSWISCEETTLGETVRISKTGKKAGGFKKPHGYCFEVPASANSVVTPVPLKAMGRFTHEAIGFDRKSGVVYLTEDYNPAGFYRFLPKRNKRLIEGTLEVLKIRDRDNFDTRKGHQAGMSWAASWVKIENPDPIEADVDPSAVFNQGVARGAASFARLEGCYTDEKGAAYFTATSGGDNNGGQIWKYQPIGKTQGKLTLVFESPSRDILDMPDNICLHPKNNLMFICEDSDYIDESGTPSNFIRILTPQGKIADFAKNISEKNPKSEFAGSVFSGDGKTLFVNLQTAALTFAITGDWKNFKA